MVAVRHHLVAALQDAIIVAHLNRVVRVTAPVSFAFAFSALCQQHPRFVVSAPAVRFHHPPDSDQGAESGGDHVVPDLQQHARSDALEPVGHDQGTIPPTRFRIVKSAF